MFKHKSMASCLFFLIFLLCFDIYAAPSQYVHKSILVDYTYSGTFIADESGEHIIETGIQNDTGDTVLYVGQVSTVYNNRLTEIAQNDDCIMDYPQSMCPLLEKNSNRRSLVRVNLTSGAEYFIFVKAYRSCSTCTSYPGTTKVFITRPSSSSRTLLASNAPFGGREIDVNDSSSSDYNPSNTYRYETVKNPGDNLENTWFIGFKCPTISNPGKFEIAYFIHSTGINGQVRSDEKGICKVIVTSLIHFSNTKKISFYINDLLITDSSGSRDSDGDGLGLELEKELGICDRRSQGGICNAVNGTRSDPGNQFQLVTSFVVNNLKDTDGDGIEDNIEVLGKEEGASSTNYIFEEFSKMGLDPRVKDVLFEVDYFSNHWSQPLTIGDIEYVWNRFKVAPKTHMQSLIPGTQSFPNDWSSIRLHFDIGQNPPSGSDYEKYGLYGDWGGTNSIPLGDPLTVENRMKNETIRNSQLKNNIRKMYFRHIVSVNDASSGCSGAAFSSPGRNILIKYALFGILNVCGPTLTHEIGHVLGLEHGQHPKHGDVNGNPLYPSIMNYSNNSAYDQFYMPSNDPSVTYATVNPSNVNELDGLGHNLPLVRNVFKTILGSLQLDPYMYTNMAIGFGLQNSIDWTKDGAFNSEPIRYPLTLVRQVASSSGANLSDRNREKMKDISSLTNTTTPKIIYFRPVGFPSAPPRIYVFYVSGGKIFYRYSTYLLTPNSKGSCTGGDKLRHMDSLGKLFPKEVCSEWSDDKEIPGITNAVSVSAIYIDSLGLTSNQQSIFQNNIMIAFSLTDGSLFTRISQNVGLSPDKHTGGDIQWVSSGNTLIVESGGVSKEPSLVYTSRLGPKKISIFYIDDTLGQYRSRSLKFDTQYNPYWGGAFELFDKDDNLIIGNLSPSTIYWPDRSHPDGFPCGVFGNGVEHDNGIAKLYCKSNGRWRPLTELSNVSAKVGLTYRIDRWADGSLLHPHSFNGRFWIVYHGANGSITTPIGFNVKISNERSTDFGNKPNGLGSPTFSGNSLYFFNTRRNGSIHTNTTGVNPGFSLISDVSLSSVRGVTVYSPDSQVIGGDSGAGMYFLPFVDGTFDVDFSVGSDFKIMSSGICRGIRPDTPNSEFGRNPFCGDRIVQKWIY